MALILTCNPLKIGSKVIHLDLNVTHHDFTYLSTFCLCNKYDLNKNLIIAHKAKKLYVFRVTSSKKLG